MWARPICIGHRVIFSVHDNLLPLCRCEGAATSSLGVHGPSEGVDIIAQRLADEQREHNRELIDTYQRA